MPGICIHTAVSTVDGSCMIHLGPSLQLDVKGRLRGAIPATPFTVVISSMRERPLSIWLRALAVVAPTEFVCPGHAELQYTVPYTNDGFVFVSRDINYSDWTIPMGSYLPPLRLTQVIGMLPVRLRVMQGDIVFIDLKVQRRQHCVHLDHSTQPAVPCTRVLEGPCRPGCSS